MSMSNLSLNASSMLGGEHRRDEIERRAKRRALLAQKQEDEKHRERLRDMAFDDDGLPNVDDYFRAFASDDSDDDAAAVAAAAAAVGMRPSPAAALSRGSPGRASRTLRSPASVAQAAADHLHFDFGGGDADDGVYDAGMDGIEGASSSMVQSPASARRRGATPAPLSSIRRPTSMLSPAGGASPPNMRFDDDDDDDDDDDVYDEALEERRRHKRRVSYSEDTRGGAGHPRHNNKLSTSALTSRSARERKRIDRERGSRDRDRERYSKKQSSSRRSRDGRLSRKRRHYDSDDSLDDASSSASASVSSGGSDVGDSDASASASTSSESDSRSLSVSMSDYGDSDSAEQRRTAHSSSSSSRKRTRRHVGVGDYDDADELSDDDADDYAARFARNSRNSSSSSSSSSSSGGGGGSRGRRYGGDRDDFNDDDGDNDDDNDGNDSNDGGARLTSRRRSSVRSLSGYENPRHVYRERGAPSSLLDDDDEDLSWAAGDTTIAGEEGDSRSFVGNVGVDEADFAERAAAIASPAARRVHDPSLGRTVRRSTRQRVGPLEWWRSEVPAYEQPESETRPGTRLIGVRDRGAKVREAEREAEQRRKQRARAAEQTTSDTFPVYNAALKTTQSAVVVKTLPMLESEQQPIGTGLAEAKFLDSNRYAVAMIDVQAGKTFSRRKPVANDELYTVVGGQADVTIGEHGAEFVVHRGAVFMVPQGNRVQVTNVSRAAHVLLSVVTLKT